MFVYGVIEFKDGDDTFLDKIFENKEEAWLYMLNTCVSKYSNRGFYLDKWPEVLTIDVNKNTGELYATWNVCTFTFIKSKI